MSLVHRLLKVWPPHLASEIGLCLPPDAPSGDCLHWGPRRPRAPAVHTRSPATRLRVARLRQPAVPVAGERFGRYFLCLIDRSRLTRSGSGRQFPAYVGATKRGFVLAKLASSCVPSNELGSQVDVESQELTWPNTVDRDGNSLCVSIGSREFAWLDTNSDHATCYG